MGCRADQISLIKQVRVASPWIPEHLMLWGLWESSPLIAYSARKK